MADPNTGEARAAFLKTFRDIAQHKHRYDVFRDFVVMAACSLHNGLRKDETREEEYLKIIHSYDKDDQQRFPELLAHLVTMLEPEPQDILGPLYMELEVASKDQGQFFTPPDVSELMARMLHGDEILPEGRPFVTLSEPAVGAGGMVLAYVKVMTEQGLNPMRRLWVEAVDIDRLAALMAYVQLSLWNVPAKILVGNTLSLDFRECWYTPAHYLGNWDHRLATQQGEAEVIPKPEPESEPEPEEPKRDEPPPEIFALTWKGINLTISWKAEWLGGLSGHLEIWSENKEPLPITETGYRSHFCSPEEVIEAGGPVAYVQAWIESKDDGKAVQLSLF